MTLFQDRLARDLSRLELTLVVAVLIVLTLVVIDRAEALFARAEQAQLEAAVHRLSTSVQLAAAARIMRGGAVEDLAGANPFALGDSPPAQADVPLPREAGDRYLGELSGPQLETLPGGRWYFDADARYAVYLVEHAGAFRSRLPGRPRARFHVVLDYRDRHGDGVFTPGVDRISGVRLTPVEPYGWR